MKTTVYIICIGTMIAMTGYADWDYAQYRDDLGYYYAEKQYANSGFKCVDPQYALRLERYNRDNRCYYNRGERYYDSRVVRYVVRDDSRYVDRDIVVVQPAKEENKYRRNEYYQKAPRSAEPVPVVSAVNKYDMETGWIKFEVQPENADVTVDTKYIGQAKKYNGYPEQYVSLIGTRKVTLRAKGYKEAVFLVNVDRESRTLVECKLDPVTNIESQVASTAEEVPELEGNITYRLK